MSFNEEAMQVFLNFDQMMGDAPVNTYKEGAVDGTAALKAEPVEAEDNGTSNNERAADLTMGNGGFFLIDDGAPFNGGEMQVKTVFDPVTGAERQVNEPMYSVKYAAKKLGLSHQTVRNYAYEISEHLGGGRTSDGNLLFTSSDIDLIGDVYKFCKAKGIKKSLASEYYFGRDNADSSSDESATPSAGITDIKDKFLESMFEKMDMLTSVMEKLAGRIDDNSKVISSFEKQIDEQNAVIGDIKTELSDNKAEHDKIMGAVKSASDSVRNSVNDNTKKAKDEILEAISKMPSAQAPDLSEMEKSIEETRNAVKGLAKILNRIDARASSANSVDMEAIERMIKDSRKNSVVADNSALVSENEALKARIAELEKASAKINADDAEVEKLRTENKALSDKLLNAENASRSMAKRIGELENGGSVDSALISENETLRKQLLDTQKAFKNMSAYLKDIENKKDDDASDSALLEENKRLSGELETSNSVMRQMAAHIAALEQGSGSSSSGDATALSIENAQLKEKLQKTTTAFMNISAHLKEVESQNSADVMEELLRLRGENEALKGELDKKDDKKADKGSKKASKGKSAGDSAKPVKEKKAHKGLFAKKDKTPSDILPVKDEISEEEYVKIERAARSLDIDSSMPDIDDERPDYMESDEWHDELEDIPDVFGGLNDVDDEFEDNEAYNAAVADKPKKTKPSKDEPVKKDEAKKKKFFGLF